MISELSILVRLQDAFEISAVDVAELEGELDAVFPTDYRSFLLSHNAAWWRHGVLISGRTPSFPEYVTLDHSLGIVRNDGFGFSNIRYECSQIENPDGLMPIMQSNGSLVMLGVTKRFFGRVYLWDFDDSDKLHFIADSFSEFLQGLQPTDEYTVFFEKLPVFQAVERGDETEVLAYLMEGGNVECRNAKGHTLLMCAARNSWPKIVQLILAHGANPNAADRLTRSPLHHAVRGQSNDSLKLLLAAGGDSHYRDRKGRTLAQIAEGYGYFRLKYTIEDFWQRETVL